MSGIRFKPTYKHTDDRWPMLISVDYENDDVVRWYVPDGGTDIGMRRNGAKMELLRKMHDHLLLYERLLDEAGYTFEPQDWTMLLARAGVSSEDGDALWT